MTPTEHEALVEALRSIASAVGRALAVLEGTAVPVAAPVPDGTTDLDRQRRLKAERQRRWRAKKASTETVSASTEASPVASTSSTAPSTVASTPSTETSTPASTEASTRPSRACARSSSSEEKNSEEEKNIPPTPKGGVETLTLETPSTSTAKPSTRRRAPNALVDPAAVAEPVRRVWEAYRKAVGGRVTLTQARVELVRQRMAEGWSVEDLEASLAGFATSKWHFGENDRGTRYTDLELWLRDARRIEQGLGLYDKNVKGGGTGLPVKTKPAPAPLNGIEAKFDKYFAEHPEGTWKW